MTGIGTVHLVDDDDSYIKATARLLTLDGFQVVTFTSGRHLMAAVTPATRGCIVVDLNMPELDGLQLQAMLSVAGVHMPLVFLSGHGDIPSTVRAMQGGAVDFLEKQAPRERLVAAIRRGLERDASEHEEHARLADLKRRFGTLSKRELEVLREVLRGQLNKQVAATLGISERTVKLHRRSIKSKVGAHTAARLVALARDAGLTDERPSQSGN